MFITYIVVTISRRANIFSATLDYIRYQPIHINMAKVSLPESWITTLGILKARRARIADRYRRACGWNRRRAGLVLFFIGCHHHTCADRLSLDWRSMLTIENVTKRFGEIVALDRVSLSLARGEFFGLLGPNGAGKTTLMSLVAGLRAPDSGSISINGQRVGPNAMAPRHELGFVPQAIALYEELSAEENLRLFGKLYGLAGQELRARVDHGLHAAQLFERRQDKVQTYSGGMKRRINVVASILHRPALLLCDEPTVGVDPQSRNAIFEFLQRLNADGMTIVYSTHYMEEATRLCSRIAIIDHGRLLALGTLDELLTHLPFSELVRIARNDQTTAQMQALAEYGEITKAEDAYLFKLRDGLRFSEFFAAAEELGLPYRYFNIRRPTLEDLFLHLTGKNLRDT